MVCGWMRWMPMLMSRRGDASGGGRLNKMKSGGSRMDQLDAHRIFGVSDF
jgi:hypothetical protein